NVVGVMVVVEDSEAKKSEYRKFKIKSFAGSDDTRALKEVLTRRLSHTEWSYPKLIVVDGGRAQVNTAEKVLKESRLEIAVVGVVKDDKHRPKEILGDAKLRREHEKVILLANSEAHRFAIQYHRERRNSNML
ncbi:excinuclease ABC subunit C, partial [bacterium]|nr:excinuclease ABC subunit C [bacterium]